MPLAEFTPRCILFRGTGMRCYGEMNCDFTRMSTANPRYTEVVGAGKQLIYKQCFVKSVADYSGKHETLPAESFNAFQKALKDSASSKARIGIKRFCCNYTVLHLQRGRLGTYCHSGMLRQGYRIVCGSSATALRLVPPRQLAFGAGAVPSGTRGCS